MDKRLFYGVLCVMGLFALLSSTMSKSPLLNYFGKSLTNDQFLLGFIAAASTVPGVLISLPAGSLSDRWGSARVIIVSGVVFASAPFLYVFIADPYQLIVVRFYHGFATAMFGPVANAAIVSRFPESKAEKISLFSSITYIGRFVAPLLGGYLVLVTASNFREIYIIDGIAGAIALLIAIGLRRNGEGREAVVSRIIKGVNTSSDGIGRRSLRRDWKEVFSNAKILGASFVEATQYYTIGAFEFYVAAYAIEIINLDSFSVGIVALFEPLTVFLAKPVMGRLSDRIGRRKPILAGLVLGGLALVALPFWSQFIGRAVTSVVNVFGVALQLNPEFLGLVVVSMMYGLGISLVTSSTPPLVAEVCRKEVYGSALGFLSTIMDVGQMLGPIVTGLLLAATFGYVVSFAHLGMVLFLSSLVFGISTRKGKTSQSSLR